MPVEHDVAGGVAYKQTWIWYVSCCKCMKELSQLDIGIKGDYTTFITYINKAMQWKLTDKGWLCNICKGAK